MTPTDLSDFPLWQQLVDRDPSYRAAWLAGTWPPGPPTGMRITARRPAAPTPVGGPGTELKRLLARFWIRDSAGCGCTNHAREMDRRGPDWCEENTDRITDWMAEAARKRSLPFSRFAARILIRRAIRNARRRAATSASAPPTNPRAAQASSHA